MNEFAVRHVGPRADDIDAMVAAMGYPSLDAFIAAVIPAGVASDNAAEPSRRPLRARRARHAARPSGAQ